MGADISRRRSEAGSSASSTLSLRDISRGRPHAQPGLRTLGAGDSRSGSMRGRGGRGASNSTTLAANGRRSVPTLNRAQGAGGGDARTVVRLARNSAGGISKPAGSSAAPPSAAPRWSSPGSVSAEVEERDAKGALGRRTATYIESTLPPVKTSLPDTGMSSPRTSTMRPGESTLPPVKSRLANGRTSSAVDLRKFGIEVGSAKTTATDDDDVVGSSTGVDKRPRQLWKDTWGPGASSVPPDPSTVPKVEGFVIQQTMPVAFNGFITAAACSWGGREKNRWKKENQDTFVLSHDCKGGGQRSDGEAVGDGALGHVRGGRNRHSTGSSPGSASSMAGMGGGDSSACLLAVMDGHGTHGRYVSTFVRDALLKDLCEEVHVNASQGMDLFGSATPAAVHAAAATITAACRRTDQALRAADRDVKLSGTTCALVVVTPDRLLAANVGDSRVVLGRVKKAGSGAASLKSSPSTSSRSSTGRDPAAVPASGLEAMPLTKDHKPDDPRECTRILANNGRVAKLQLGSGVEVGPNRVFLKFSWTPGLAVSRAFGDLLAQEVGVTSEPDVNTFNIEEEDRLIVVASDGVWEHLTDQEVIDIAANAGGYSSDPSLLMPFDNMAAARAVCAAARVRWTSESAATVDDITAVVAYMVHQVRDNAPARLTAATRRRGVRMSMVR